MICPICQNGRGVPAQDHPGYTICCEGYLSPRTVTYDEAYWPARSGSMQAHRDLVTKDRLAWWLEHIPTRGRILEVGCAPGALLDALVARGDDALGVDPTMPEGDRVRSGEFPGVSWPGPFDAVVMLDVLEHAPDPRGMLFAARMLLHPGGRLYIQSPTLRGQAMEERFWLAGEHTWIPTQRGLNTVLTELGYVIVSDRETWHSGHEWTVANAT